MKLLIVDDSAAMRAVVADMVAALGCETRECDNGLDAAAQYRQWRPDWVVMDVRMPGMDGLSSTRMIRQEFPEARVILVSIHAGSEMSEAAMAAGAFCFLLKTRLAELPGLLTGR